DPLWERIGAAWNTALPLKEDLALQMNTIRYTEFVVNLGSSMVFDYAAHNKPCCYINYNLENSRFRNWVKKVYNYIHFRSMPDPKSVFWLNSREELPSIFKAILSGNNESVPYAKRWFEIINAHPPATASERIWESISGILKL
ncbi:MAG TPA: UDP-glycosyltransferase, partial [Flavobacterium sp.]